jgi:hypothetical protein
MALIARIPESPDGGMTHDRVRILQLLEELFGGRAVLSGGGQGQGQEERERGGGKN